MFRAVLCISCLCLFSLSATVAAPAAVSRSTVESKPVVLVKIGGSSITHKAVRETLNEAALQWFVETIRETSDKHAYVIVHGAGSFGHMTASEFGLRGQTDPPPTTAQQTRLKDDDSDSKNQQQKQQDEQLMMKGLAQTRVSVQKLNQALVAALMEAGLNAVGISPCFGVPGIEAHGGDERAQRQLQRTVHAAVVANLIPVLHGDACLYGERGAGILSGDVVMEMLGFADWVSHVVFLTDVDGVFTSDPNTDPDNAVLIRTLTVDPATTEIVSASVGDNEDADGSDKHSIKLTGSTHEHDVTGGLQTKLQSAATLAATGKAVTIVRCGSSSAEQALRMQEPSLATVLAPRWRLVPAANTTSCETTSPSNDRIDS